MASSISIVVEGASGDLETLIARTAEAVAPLLNKKVGAVKYTRVQLADNGEYFSITFE